jgi:hypothetical protein
MAILLAGGLAASLGSLYVFFFPFIEGGDPKKDKQYADVVMDKCGYPKNAGFFSTLLTLGYTRLAIERFRKTWASRLGLNDKPVRVGERAPDASLFTLRGEKKSLLADYIVKTKAGYPLVLNFGSYS